MYRVSVGVLIGIIAATTVGWLASGRPLEAPRQAGWTDFGTWGVDGTAARTAAGAAGAVTVAKKAAAKLPEEAPAPAPEEQRPPLEPDTAAMDAARGVVASAEPEAAPAPAAEPEVAPATVTAPAIEWPIATEVPDWSQEMKVRIAASAEEPAAASAPAAEPEPAPAAEPAAVAESVTAPAIEWPIATEVPDWSLEMKVRIATPAADPEEQARAKEEEARQAAEVEAARKQAEEQARAKEEEARQAAEAEAARKQAEEQARAKEEEARQAAEAEAARKQAEEQARAKEEEARRAAAEEKRRQALSTEQIACEDELRKIYKSGTVLFESKSAAIDASSEETLKALATAAKGCAKVRIRIEGHTDARGTKQDNQLLSEKRAAAIADYLVSAGLDRGVIAVAGFGEERPVAPNDSDENMRKNRRIEFTVY